MITIDPDLISSIASSILEKGISVPIND